MTPGVVAAAVAVAVAAVVAAMPSVDVLKLFYFIRLSLTLWQNKLEWLSLVCFKICK